MQVLTARAARTWVRTAAAVTAVVLALTAGAASAMLPGGLDTSHYQHSPSLNWSAVKASGAKFAFLKATEGSSYRDPYFHADWQATASVGLYHGAYHFARPSVGSAAAQARYFVSKIGPQKVRGTLPPVLDLEATGGLSPAQLINWTRTWLSTVAQLTGRKPIIYVSPMFWKYHMKNSGAFHGYPLWVANYGVSRPTVPGGWPAWSFWQTTSSGRVSGVSGNVDRDVFNGSLTGLQKFALAYSPSGTSVTLHTSNAAPTTGQSITLSGVLRDASGHLLRGQRVTVTSQTPGSSSTSRVGVVTTSSRATFSIRTVVRSAATYRATFAGTSSYRGSTSPAVNVKLKPIPTTLSLSPSATKALAGTRVTLSGALAAGARPLAGQMVTISRRLVGSRAWTVLARPRTDTKGGFSVTQPMLKSASYRAQFTGSPAYTSSSAAAVAITVTLNPSALSLEVSNSAPYAHRNVTLQGTLSNGTRPVSGHAVMLARRTAGSPRWSTVTTATTDAAGHYSALLVVDQAARYRAVFAGDSLYATSTSQTKAITITPPAPTRLTIRDGSRSNRLRKGRPMTLTGRLATRTGDPVVERTVGVWKRLVGSSHWYRVARTATGRPDGSWQVTVRPRRSCWFKARYFGSSRYAGVQSATVRVDVR